MSSVSDQKLEEVLKWKLEAIHRKIESHLASQDAKQQQLSKHVQSLERDCHQEYAQLKQLVVSMTSDVLEQVANDVLPQAEF